MTRKNAQSQPETYVPKSPEDFIGGARQLAFILKGKAQRMLKEHDAKARVLLYGAPGIGKTALADMFAAMLTEHKTQVESINGRNVTVEVIRRWQHEACFVAAFNKFTVKIVNELDTCPAASQDLLLTYLDEQPKCSAFIGTSNLDLKHLAERFQSRLQQFKVEAPDTSEINGFLARWKIAQQTVKQIAVGCGGNVRAALLDTQSILDAKAAQ